MRLFFRKPSFIKMIEIHLFFSSCFFSHILSWSYTNDMTQTEVPSVSKQPQPTFQLELPLQAADLHCTLSLLYIRSLLNQPKGTFELIENQNNTDKSLVIYNSKKYINIFVFLTLQLLSTGASPK